MKFLTGKKLNQVIYDTIFNAEKTLIILSPFIQLDDYFKHQVFKTHFNKSNLHLILGFGKNLNDINKSFKKEDIAFFKKHFLNITIVYLPNLHAKYYGNEKESVISSMNLIDYSFDNNIEFGVHSKKTVIATGQFQKTQKKCIEIMEDEGYTIFVRRPTFIKKNFGLSKDYVGSNIKLDLIDRLMSGENIEKESFKKYPADPYANSSIKQKRIEKEETTPKKIPFKKTEKLTHVPIKKIQKTGCCIRCKETIELNLKRPFCDKCFQKWNEYKNNSYREKYCLVCKKNIKSMDNDDYVLKMKPTCKPCYAKLNN